jgi:hypothetical protein
MRSSSVHSSPRSRHPKHGLSFSDMCLFPFF